MRRTERLPRIALAGLAWARAVTVRRGDGSLEDDAFLGLNLEAGVRYAFLLPGSARRATPHPAARLWPRMMK